MLFQHKSQERLLSSDCFITLNTGLQNRAIAARRVSAPSGRRGSQRSSSGYQDKLCWDNLDNEIKQFTPTGLNCSPFHQCACRKDQQAALDLDTRGINCGFQRKQKKQSPTPSVVTVGYPTSSCTEYCKGCKSTSLVAPGHGCRY